LPRRSPGAKVKHLFVIQLPDRRAVRAFYVIGKDLELGLRVDHRAIRQQEGLVRRLASVF